MNIRLHKNATTPRIRALIQVSDAPQTVLTRRFGVSLETLARWKHRDSVEDQPHTAGRIGQGLSGAHHPPAERQRHRVHGPAVREPGAGTEPAACMRSPVSGTGHRAPPDAPAPSTNQWHGRGLRAGAKLPGGALQRAYRRPAAHDLEQTLHRYVTLYNHHVPQQALNAHTPVQALQDRYALKPELFLRKPSNRPGRDM